MNRHFPERHKRLNSTLNLDIKNRLN